MQWGEAHLEIPCSHFQAGYVTQSTMRCYNFAFRISGQELIGWAWLSHAPSHSLAMLQLFLRKTCYPRPVMVSCWTLRKQSKSACLDWHFENSKPWKGFTAQSDPMVRKDRSRECSLMLFCASSFDPVLPEKHLQCGPSTAPDLQDGQAWNAYDSQRAE